MLIVDKDADVKRKLTAEEIETLEALKETPIEQDELEDFPELTDEQLSQLAKASRAKRMDETRRKTVSVRLSPQALQKAQSLGKGYTSVLSRILESALSDNETIKHYL
jgi:uncharacterized protein (DUF4415 family)